MHMYVPASPVPSFDLHEQPVSAGPTEVNTMRGRLVEFVDVTWGSSQNNTIPWLCKTTVPSSKTWTKEEDKLLVESKRLFENNWDAISENMKSTGKNREQCQNRMNLLNRRKRQRTERQEEALNETSSQPKKAKTEVSEGIPFARYHMLSNNLPLASKNNLKETKGT